MAFSILSRILWLMERRARARRYSVPYVRDKSWAVPGRVQIAGRWVDLSYPTDEGSSIAFKDIFISDVYWLDRLRNKDIRTVLDVGAHVGFFSLAASHCFPGATCHAYEPNEMLGPHLLTHAGAAGFVAFPNAVGAAAGRVSLQEGQDSVFTQCSLDEHGKVEMTAISEAVRRVAGDGRLDLLKMDCEGGEWDILTDETTLKKVRFLTMEYHLFPDRTLPRLQQILQDLGFKIVLQQADGDANGRILAARQDGR